MTAVFVLPVTVAVKVGRLVVAAAFTVAVAGETEMVTGGFTVMVAVAAFVVSAAEVAVTVTVRAAVTDAGGVYTPAVEIEPQPFETEHDTDQVTDVFVEPVIVAVKVGRLAVEPAVTVAVAGDTVMLTL